MVAARSASEPVPLYKSFNHRHQLVVVKHTHIWHRLLKVAVLCNRENLECSLQLCAVERLALCNLSDNRKRALLNGDPRIRHSRSLEAKAVSRRPRGFIGNSSRPSPVLRLLRTKSRIVASTAPTIGLGDEQS